MNTKLLLNAIHIHIYIHFQQLSLHQKQNVKHVLIRRDRWEYDIKWKP